MDIFRLAQRPKSDQSSDSSPELTKATLERDTDGCAEKGFLNTTGDSQLTSALVADSRDTSLLQLPPEIFQQILSNLQCQSLVSLSGTCTTLRHQALSDLLWANLLRSHLPPHDFPTVPYPSSSYRELYVSHHPFWFLPKNKIWFSDDPHTGRTMLIKFDPRRGCIEGYRLLADRGDHKALFWNLKPGVVIHGFNPRVHLWLDDPVLKLNHERGSFNTKQGWWEGEIEMRVGRAGHNTSATFFLGRNIPPQLLDKSMEVWPPRTIPGMPRVRAVSRNKFRGRGHKPQTYEEISQTTFRMRQWSQFAIDRNLFGVRMGEEVTTWSTVDPILYTPTRTRPYQGIFVGDYAGHGCEFLLVTQTDKAPDPPDPPEHSDYYDILTPAALESLQEVSLSLNRAAMNGPAAVEDPLYRGAIEAIKLTGDPNIPRGEHTFIADDISSTGLIRIANEPPFCGARIVRSRGHCAGRGFTNDEFIPSQLILVSHDRLAQYWVPFGHVSFYQRVDIDQLLGPVLDTQSDEER